MNTMIIAELHDENIVTAHRVDMTGQNKRDEYASLKSLNGFRRRERERVIRHIRKNGFALRPRSFQIYFVNEWEFETKMMRKRGYGVENILFRDHSSIWDFYAAVGFDHRKNRYV